MAAILNSIFDSKLTWVGFFLILYLFYIYIRIRYIKKREKSEIEKLVELSYLLNTSEYHIFEMASDKWEISKARVDDDFKKYIQNTEVPFYVRDLIRSYEKKLQNNPEIDQIISDKYSSL